MRSSLSETRANISSCASTRRPISSRCCLHWSQVTNSLATSTGSGVGSFRPVPVGGGRWARLDAQLLALLGFRSGSRPGRYATLLRLSRAGFVEMVKVSPGCWLLDLDSWHRHLTACMDDPEMWEPGSEAVRRYNFANGLGGTGLRAPRRSKAAPKAAPKAPKAKSGKAAKSGLV